MIGEYNQEDGIKLLKLVRESIEQEFTGKEPAELKDKKFQEKRGVFVTLHKKGSLRGCIGFPYPMLPLEEAVKKAAKSSAFNDFRFMPLQKEELKDIKIEISILTVPKECKENEIKIGKDGLICEYLGYQGLLLPQVATENNFNRVQFLECLCNKAGLPNDTWQSKNFKLFKFQAQIFKE